MLNFAFDALNAVSKLLISTFNKVILLDVKSYKASLEFIVALPVEFK